MKVLVLFSLVALCYSTPITVQKRVTVGGDGTITIMGTQGREIDIYRSVIDPTKLNIIIKSQYGIARKIQVDETADIKNVDFNTLDARFFKNMPREQITQANILVHIFREYEGLVDEPTYKILLGRIETLVQQGYLHDAILEALRTLDQLRMVEDVKQVEAKDVMDNIVREKLVEDVEYPVNEVSQLRRVSEVVPVEGVFGINQYKNILPIQGYQGVQGLWNMQNWTPYQRQIILQHLRQLQYGQGLGEEVMPTELLREQELTRDMTHQQIMQQIYQRQLGQTETSPLNRYLYTMGVLRGQGFYYPQQHQQYRIPQYQGQYQYQQHVPQQLNTWEQNRENIYENVYPRYVQREVVPQEIERLVEQGRFVPQQIERLVEQSRYAPQETVYQQYNYGRVPMVY